METFLDHVQACDTVITHDSCADGTASALFLADVLPKADIRFVQYGTRAFKELRPESGRKYLFCDMSPAPEVAQAFVDAGSVILDHHATAKSVVASFGDLGVFADEKADPGVSGAMLAFTRVWMPLRGADTSTALFSWAARFAKLSGVYDTWQKSDPEWSAAVELIRTMHFQDNVDWLKIGLRGMAECWEQKYQWLGPILVAKGDKSARRTAESVIKYRTNKGTKIGMVNARGINDLPTLCPQADLLVGFGYEIQMGRLRLVCSLRSRGGYDCSALAKRHDGGGHRPAAGMSLPVDLGDSNPYEVIYRAVEAFEQSMTEVVS